VRDGDDEKDDDRGRIYRIPKDPPALFYMSTPRYVDRDGTGGPRSASDRESACSRACAAAALSRRTPATP
jgi:hypothetical protein